METCKTCKWWRYRSMCDRIDSLPMPPPEQRFEIDVEVLDYTGLVIRLMTGPDFGCIHHSIKQ